jgi:GNAT superfamily N-acetyltransferase
METASFDRTHIESFLCSAKAEGWITDQLEIEFLLHAYPEGCLVCLDNDRPAGFITAIRYLKSAWVGNLLVLPEYRCRGIGRALMQKVLQVLDSGACETVWLTASADGAPLYGTLGFKQIDTVQRWRGSGTPTLQGTKPEYTSAVATMDCMGWGDERRSIFDKLPENCSSFTAHDGFLVHSSCGEGQQIGPWGALSGDAAAVLLETASGGEGPEKEIFLDVPENNHAAGGLLSSRGFCVSGSTLLMYRGKEPEYRAEFVYSLASMGSYG